MMTTAVCVFNGDNLLFTIEVFKYRHPNATKVDAIDVDEEYQNGITYGQVLKDLGRCAFMQIIKNRIRYAGEPVRRSKVVGKIA